jgi:protein dithiol oxidoreductase (disulfide-forming)
MKLLTRWLLGTFFGLLCGGIATGFAQPLAGKDYQLIKRPQPTDSGDKIQVSEFFWYGCPHCNYLQPALHTWLKTLPPDVVLNRQPAAFNDSWVQGARTYYTLDAMGLVDKLHREVFAAIHVQNKLDPKILFKDPKSLFDWIATKGVDRKRFIDTYNSFSVVSRAQRTKDITAAHNISGTPSLVVDGRYLMSPGSYQGSKGMIDYERFFRAVDQVIAMVRASRAVRK